MGYLSKAALRLWFLKNKMKSGSQRHRNGSSDKTVTRVAAQVELFGTGESIKKRDSLRPVCVFKHFTTGKQNKVTQRRSPCKCSLVKVLAVKS